jgi:hypothetical protein
MGEQFSRAEQLERRAQTLLGALSANEAPPLEFKPARSVGDLLTQHLEELEREAKRTDGVLRALSAHSRQIFKASTPPLGA